MPLTSEELALASVDQLQDWRQQCDQVIESRTRGWALHTLSCSAIIDDLFDQIVNVYLANPHSRKKLAESLGKTLPDDRDCPGCVARLRITWQRLFSLLGPDEWTPRILEIRGILGSAESEPKPDPPRILDRLLANSFLDDLCL